MSIYQFNLISQFLLTRSTVFPSARKIRKTRFSSLIPLYAEWCSQPSNQVMIKQLANKILLIETRSYFRRIHIGAVIPQCTSINILYRFSFGCLGGQGNRLISNLYRILRDGTC